MTETSKDRPRVFWKPAEDHEPACLSIEVNGPKRYLHIWNPGAVSVLEWGWTLADTAIELTHSGHYGASESCRDPVTGLHLDPCRCPPHNPDYAGKSLGELGKIMESPEYRNPGYGAPERPCCGTPAMAQVPHDVLCDRTRRTGHLEGR